MDILVELERLGELSPEEYEKEHKEEILAKYGDRNERRIKKARARDINWYELKRQHALS